MKSTSTVELSPQSLKTVFPYHVAVDEEFQILQMGEKLEKYFVKHGKDMNYVIGTRANEIFKICYPPTCSWNWKNFINSKSTTYHLEIDLSKYNIPNLPLSGKVIVTDPSTDLQVKAFGGLFLLNLRVRNLDDLSANNLQLKDISEYNMQHELIATVEHLKSELNSVHRLDTASKVTAIKVLEEETNKAKNMLDTKRTFVRYISHEIRTPLNVVMLGLKMIEDSMKQYPSEEWPHHITADMINDMRGSCDVAVSTLNDLLMYEKIEGNLMKLELEEMKIYDSVKTVIKSFNVQATSSGVILTHDIEAIVGVFANVDIHKLNQVVRNILSNALKFTPEGERVKVHAEIISQDSILDPDMKSNLVPSEVSNIKHKSSFFSQGDTITSKQRSITLSGATDVSRRVGESFDSFATIDSSNESHLMNNNVNLLRPTTRSMRNEEATHITTITPDNDKPMFVRISVEDSGPGISESNQKGLFTEFSQVNANQLQKGGGSGLGLWVARNIMEAHGGKIGVYSAGEGRGATFYIELPISFIEYKKKVIYPTETLKKASYIESVSSSTYVSAGDGATMIPDSPSQKSDILTSRTDTSAITSASTKIGNISTSCPVESILVVDDSISNRKMIRRLLESRGRFQFVDEACNGEKALLKIAEKSYDVIMMDSEMPILNGPDAVSIMRSNGYKGLIIGVTGNSLQADMDSFQNAGCNKVISKPIDIDDFVKYVQGM